MAKTTSLRELGRAADEDLLQAIAVASQRALEGYRVEIVGNLYEEQRGLTLARGVIYERGLDDTRTNDEFRVALGVLSICYMTLRACGRGNWALGVDRLRMEVARVLEAELATKTRLRAA
jgi:hypothetical protein